MNRQQLIENIYQASEILTSEAYHQRVADYLEKKLVLDIGNGDLTAQLIPTITSNARIIAKDSGILAGLEDLKPFYEKHEINAHTTYHDGDFVKKGNVIFSLVGDSKTLLSTERTALNYLQMMSGIATNTKQFVDRANGVVVAATRKDWSDEWLEKKAVIIGGGYSHRLGLDGFMMIKDNHLSIFKKTGSRDSIREFIHKAYVIDYSGPLNIEVGNFKDALKAANVFSSLGELGGKITPIVMLDNMTPDMVKDIVPRIRDSVLVEVSGNIDLETIADYASAGPDVISTSKLNRGAQALDLSQKI